LDLGMLDLVVVGLLALGFDPEFIHVTSDPTFYIPQESLARIVHLVLQPIGDGVEEDLGV
jgi:hypothetical protein